MSYYLRRNYRTIFITVEKYEPEIKTVLIDFFDSNETTLFERITNFKTSDKPSMIIIENYDLKKLTEGTVYELAKEVIEELIENRELTNYEDSFLIGYRINIGANRKKLFGKSKSFTTTENSIRNVNINVSNPKVYTKLNPSGDMYCIVRNVGQGNWNELFVDDTTYLVYDCGTHYLTNRSQVIKYIDNRETLFQKDKPVLIISHWDVDHYHCLLAMSDITLSSFEYVMFKNYIPNLTSRKLMARFLKLIPHCIHTLSSGRAIKIKKVTKLTLMNSLIDVVLVFNGSKDRDRNKCGICLIIKTNKVNIILSADHHYDQISRYLLPFLTYPSKHYLVVPHHGGKAGKFEYNMSKNLTPKLAIISVGKNSYGHPFKRYTNELHNKKFSIRKTNDFGKDERIDL